MADIEGQILDIRNRIAAAQRHRSRAEMERDTAQAAADKARAQLQSEFGVSTALDARNVLRGLENDLEGALVELNAKLDDIGV